MRPGAIKAFTLCDDKTGVRRIGRQVWRNAPFSLGVAGFIVLTLQTELGLAGFESGDTRAYADILNARDLGIVRDRDGAELGRVVAIDGDLVTWELSSGGQGSARVPEEYGARCG